MTRDGRGQRDRAPRRVSLFITIEKIRDIFGNRASGRQLLASTQRFAFASVRSFSPAGAPSFSISGLLNATGRGRGGVVRRVHTETRASCPRDRTNSHTRSSTKTVAWSLERRTTRATTPKDRTRVSGPPNRKAREDDMADVERRMSGGESAKRKHIVWNEENLSYNEANKSVRAAPGTRDGVPADAPPPAPLFLPRARPRNPPNRLTDPPTSPAPRFAGEDEDRRARHALGEPS